MSVLMIAFASLVALTALLAPASAQTCVNGVSVPIGVGTNQQLAALYRQHKERWDAICAIEAKGDKVVERLTAPHGLLPGAKAGIIAKPYEYRTTLDFNIAFGAGQCGDIRVVARYLDGGTPESMRVWITRNTKNIELYKGHQTDVVVRYCPATMGLTKFKVSAGDQARPVIALAKPK